MIRPPRGPRALLLTILAFTFVLFAGREARAQCPAQQQMIDLNRQAMGHYEQLQIDEALASLQQATALTDACISAGVRARTQANLGVVHVGGFMNNADGIAAFRTALCLDSTVQLDPLTSTPDIQTAFSLAQSQNEQQGCPAGVAPPPGGGVAPPPPGGGVAPPPDGGVAPPPGQAFELFRHEPLEAQLRSHPIPLYLEINPAVQVGQVMLFYRVAGETQFSQLEMESFGSNAFGVEIPCDTIILFDPAWVEYYIEILAPGGERIGMAPEEGRETPFRISMETELEQGVQALPGRDAPRQCVNCSDIAPGMPVPPECAAQAAGSCESGFTCDVNDDCPGSGQTCEEGCCSSEGGGGGGGGRDGSYRPYFYFQAGVGWGGGLVLQTGSPSGDEIPANALFENVGDTADCPSASQVVNADWGADSCWYSTSTAGFGMGSGHLRLYAGGYILPYLSAGVSFRYQFDGFNTQYHWNWALGLRARYHIIATERMELSVGLTFQIYGWQQVSLSSIRLEGGRETGKLWRPGGYNAVGLMVGYAYYFIPNFGVFAELTSDWTMGEFIWNLELSVGPAVRF